ncbi:hypothetical protein Pla108_41700 [Botrimarina colliarenosi]|uniref:Uncharacterized protein n=1 Tax=Botrimarina colliarenosi TaxID=2528001 RepID=A0A5C5ZW21_9BACT|nr:hypothetical protein Pla108_41700 [Botrimarina colliarenosi]
MALFELTKDHLGPIASTTFANAGVFESVIGSRKVQRPAGPGGARIVQRAAVPSEPLAGS